MRAFHCVRWLAVLGFAGHALAACTALSPFPTGTTCGQAGKLGKPPRSNDGEQTGSLETCAGWCYDDPQCAAFSRNSNKGTCSFYVGDDWKQAYQYSADTSSKDNFYSVDCFSCASKQCPPASSTNLFDNGDFQLSDTYIGPWRIDSTGEAVLANASILSPGRLSTRAASCNGACEISQRRSLCPGQFYLFSFAFNIQALVDDPPRNLGNLGVYWISPDGGNFDGSYRHIRNYINKWHRSAASFKATEDQHNFNPYFELYPGLGQGLHQFRVLWDNFVLKPIADPQTLPTSGDSLVVDGGFEQGALGAFQTTNSFYTNPTVTFPSPGLPAADGTQSQKRLHVEGQNECNGNPNTCYGAFSLSQITPSATDPLKYYKFSLTYKVTNVSEVRIIFSNHGLPDNYEWLEAAPENGQVVQFTRVVTGTGKRSGVSIMAVNNRTPEYSTIEVDNVALTELA